MLGNTTLVIILFSLSGQCPCPGIICFVNIRSYSMSWNPLRGGCLCWCWPPVSDSFHTIFYLSQMRTHPGCRCLEYDESKSTGPFYVLNRSDKKIAKRNISIHYIYYARCRGGTDPMTNEFSKMAKCGVNYVSGLTPSEILAKTCHQPERTIYIWVILWPNFASIRQANWSCDLLYFFCMVLSNLFGTLIWYFCKYLSLLFSFSSAFLERRVTAVPIWSFRYFPPKWGILVKNCALHKS